MIIQMILNVSQQVEPLLVETQRTCNASRFCSCIKSRLVASFGTVKVFLGFMVSRKAKNTSFRDAKSCRILMWSNPNPKPANFGWYIPPMSVEHWGWFMALVRLATFQKAEIQHWWTAPCSDLCYSFNNLFDEGILVAEGHGPSGREEWQARVVTLPASKFAAMPR